jgi:hypothetical protein
MRRTSGNAKGRQKNGRRKSEQGLSPAHFSPLTLL